MLLGRCKDRRLRRGRRAPPGRASHQGSDRRHPPCTDCHRRGAAKACIGLPRCPRRPLQPRCSRANHPRRPNQRTHRSQHLGLPRLRRPNHRCRRLRRSMPLFRHRWLRRPLPWTYCLTRTMRGTKIPLLPLRRSNGARLRHTQPSRLPKHPPRALAPELSWSPLYAKRLDRCGSPVKPSPSFYLAVGSTQQRVPVE